MDDGFRLPETDDPLVDAAVAALHQQLSLAYLAAASTVQAVADCVRARYGHPALGVDFRLDCHEQGGAVAIAADGTTTPLAHIDGDLSDVLESATTTLFTCGQPETTSPRDAPYPYLRHVVRARG